MSCAGVRRPVRGNTLYQGYKRTDKCAFARHRYVYLRTVFLRVYSVDEVTFRHFFLNKPINRRLKSRWIHGAGSTRLTSWSKGGVAGLPNNTAEDAVRMWFDTDWGCSDTFLLGGVFFDLCTKLTGSQADPPARKDYELLASEGRTIGHACLVFCLHACFTGICSFRRDRG